MKSADTFVINSLEELREYYGEPSPMATDTMLDFLHDHMVDFVRRSPFVAVSSESMEGLDVSPRGGEAGFVHVLDRKTVMFGDWPGNNKLETISNIITTGRCALLLLVPTLDVFLRINGAATVTRDPELLKSLVEFNKEPKVAVKVSVEQAYFHCGKAFKRSHLWVSDSWPDVTSYPKVGKIMKDLVDIPDHTSEDLNAMYNQALKDELY
ncbi:MSMEG_1061 family FMN-dependent PPOX-type flavoprotein [Kordiimonas pumila]|uniref:MSMEG_1061 family FMN-dependent PPOX-type flavoprotein n=1 Tax=Kordiimonas pumila TaxID=2161677 RepID=A0ABV7D6R8_9PROT|nr:MSMEG_1061 family FMN-dependent PPOX-type flavoprotein [Kordiimonas pumila]